MREAISFLSTPTRHPIFGIAKIKVGAYRNRKTWMNERLRQSIHRKHLQPRYAAGIPDCQPSGVLECFGQTDAKGQTQTLFYDALRRMIERRENRRLDNGTFQAEPTAKWTYGDAFLVGSSQKAVGFFEMVYRV
jgi:hypothetical protein